MRLVEYELGDAPLDAEQSLALIEAYDKFARAERRRDMLADLFGISAAKIAWRKDYELSQEAVKVIRTLRWLSRKSALSEDIKIEVV